MAGDSGLFWVGMNPEIPSRGKFLRAHLAEESSTFPG
jgi:hypothetical protein